MRTTHADHHYSITVKSPDLAVIGCLRAISQHCQRTGNPRIAYGGTKETDWSAAGHQVTFRFSQPSYRIAFESDAQRLLPSGSFERIAIRDDDPALPQRKA